MARGGETVPIRKKNRQRQGTTTKMGGTHNHKMNVLIAHVE